ncbi:aminodeoxychorismate lyase [Actinoalloteichus hymeniacidonis]|uniref:Branched-chain amino acid aminotransferase/4-amino-4-deoxychorismate lyase n=1 Tax=Actinoalloteichus hymeniacidonis TaxID=340345 RepID=A0AAC9HWW1_9PSEU|nr:aminodeoxychorismate lyase [Actinoalloteichus hymeniacidonis]AOS65960.1 branched-chain amino acid aminotransferase/4-amino-4-deoxychorismate lyase [Actinoalloteichus hymeniacidonis]MBB5905943.1 4-amino-4-deoxychorismate lyase [Actinoalloteichus hymeniacidonis]
MTVLALLDGTILDHTAPLLRVDDLAVQRGDGVFETIMVVDGRPRELGPHLDRLARSAALLDMPAPDRAAWERCAQVVIDAWTGGREMALKLVYSRGVEETGEPTAFAMGMEVGAQTIRRRTDGVAALILERGYAADLQERAPWLLLGAKTLSYAVNMAALRHAERNNADEVIFTATDDSVLEGPTSTVVIAQGRTLRTPPPASGILPGTTQGALFRAAAEAGWATKVEPLKVQELWDADGLWLVSSVRLVTKVHTLDGKVLPGEDRRNELHHELTKLFESQYA